MKSPDYKEDILFKEMLHQMPSAFILIDHQKTIRCLNPLAEALGHSRAETATSKQVTDLFPCLNPLLNEMIQTTTAQSYFHSKVIASYPDGREQLFDILAFPVSVAQTLYTGIRLEDNPGRFVPQAETGGMPVWNAQKTAIEELAHDLNNLLAGIMQSTYVVLQRLQKKLNPNELAAAENGITMDQIIAYTMQRGIAEFLENNLQLGQQAVGLINKLYAPGTARQAPLANGQ